MECIHYSSIYFSIATLGYIVAFCFHKNLAYVMSRIYLC